MAANGNKQKSKHVASLADAKPYYDSELGSLRRITVDELPILKNLSIKKLILAPGSIREPHWHAETAEMGYVHKGEARMSILDPDGSVDTYTLKPGDMYL